MTCAAGAARMRTCLAWRMGSMARFKRPPALLRSSGAWTSETRSAPIRVDAGLLVVSGPSVAVGLEAFLVGVPLPVRVGISQEVHYPL